MIKEGHPDHCSLCRQRFDEAVTASVKRISEQNRPLIEALADNRDPVRKALDIPPEISALAELDWSGKPALKGRIK